MIEDVLATALQSTISVVVLFLLTRIMGKKHLSQLTFFDYVVGISIGSIAAAFAVDSSIDYARGITGMVVYALFPIILSLIALQSYKARNVLDGKPTILVYKGQIVEKNLKKVQLTVSDVLEKCRLKNAFDIADVEYAILETSGQVSVELTSSCQPLTAKDMNIQTAYKGLCLNVVIDGEILDGHLQLIGKDEAWLQNELSKQNISDIKQVLLGYMNNDNQFVVQKKNDSIPPNPLI